jgi:hypothetical protein
MEYSKDLTNEIEDNDPAVVEGMARLAELRRLEPEIADLDLRAPRVQICG